MKLKEKIIHESLRLFSLKGSLNSSLNDILKASGSSKGGFYYHFKSKEDLFFHVLDRAQRIWRAETLDGLNEIKKPIDKLKKLLENYQNNYLTDHKNFPGGCVFITLSVELNDQAAHLSKEIDNGFDGVKGLIRRYLDESKQMGELKGEVDTDSVTEMIFAGMLGSSVIYGTNKSTESLNNSINALINYLDSLKT